jgi:DNA polymerase-3 subunit delta'
MDGSQSIIGHRRQIEQLRRAQQGGRVAHAYLFYGPDGIGKEKVAFSFAQALNCESVDNRPCGVCSSCQKIDKNNHPDVRLVASESEMVARGLREPEKSRSPSEQIRNAQLDDLADLFRHRPYMGRWKVIVVIDADKMNQHAQNRFLKTLEEPSDDSVIILVSAHPEVLLPTVRSRCQALGFGAVSRQEVANYLASQHGISSEEASLLAAMAQGSFGRAEKFVEGEILQLREQVAKLISRIQKGDLEDLLTIADEHGRSRSQVQEILEQMEVWCRDMLLAKLNVADEYFVNLDRSRDIHQTADLCSSNKLLDWIDRIRITHNQLKLNANPRMALESLLVNMRSL